MIGLPQFDEWVKWKIREAQWEAYSSGKTVELELARGQCMCIAEITRLFPGAGISQCLSQLILAFDLLPDDEKKPMKDDRTWYSDEEMRAWVRENVDKRRLTESYEPWFLYEATRPEFLAEARARFPTGDVVGLIFKHALNGNLSQREHEPPPTVAQRERSTAVACSELNQAKAAQHTLPATVFARLQATAIAEGRDLVHDVLPKYLAEEYPGEF